MPAKPPLRVALIGQGFMGRVHSNAYRQVAHFFDFPFELELKVICGRDLVRLEAMAARWGWSGVATDWRTVMERDDIDLIDIAAPNSLHAPIAIEAAHRGLTILCEKPLAVSAEEGARMVNAVMRVPNMVWFNYRRVPAIAFAKQLIDEGRIGKVFHYRATYLQQWGSDPSRAGGWKFDKEQAGSGVTGDLLSHLLDIALWLNGPITDVSAMQHTFAPDRSVEDACLAMARFANGSIGTFEATRYAIGCRNQQGFEIHGSRGALRFQLEDLNHLEFLDATEPANLQGMRRILVTGPDHPHANTFWKPGHVIGYEHTFTAALGDFLTALGRGDIFQPGFAAAQEVQIALEAVENSARSGRWQTLAD